MSWMKFYSACRSAKSGRFAKKGKCQAFKKTKVRKAPKSKKGQFQLFALAILSALALAGCATQRTTLTETVDIEGAYTKTTDIKTRTFFDSKSELARLKTSSTDKTQTVGLDGLKQESSGSNATALLENVVGAAVKAAVSAATPIP
jgi:hypothetical protein